MHDKEAQSSQPPPEKEANVEIPNKSDLGESSQSGKELATSKGMALGHFNVQDLLRKDPLNQKR